MLAVKDEPQRIRKVRLSVEQLVEARIPKQHYRLGVDTYLGDEEALRKTQSYIHNHATALRRGVGVIFHGKQNTCKTFLICYALRLLMLEDRDCYYATLRELTDAYMGIKEIDGTPIYHIFRKATFLAVDEIDQKEKTGGLKDTLTEIIKIRKTEGLPTFYGTRLGLDKTSKDNFSSIYGPDLLVDLLTHNIDVTCSADTYKQTKQRKADLAGIV